MEWADVDPSITLMTPSKWSAEGFVRSGFPDSGTWVVPHGIDPAIFKPPTPDARQAARERRGWDDDTLVFMNVGMLSHNKGIKEILQAYNQVWKAHRRECVGGGDGAAAGGECSSRRLKLVFKGPSHIPPHLDNRAVTHDGQGTQWYFHGEPLLDDEVEEDAIEIIMNSSLR